MCLDSEIMGFTAYSIGECIKDQEAYKFEGKEQFQVVEDKLYNSEHQAFWDDWDNGAD